jgi:ribosomal protein S18 acetylase RimI-like enzyme
VERFGTAQAVLTSDRPDRSLLNAAVYDEPAGVPLDELQAFFAPVLAWCIWVQPGDDDLAAACEARGMALDGTPMMMGARLDEVDLARREVAAQVGDGDWDEVGRINDAAYGVAPDEFAAIVSRLSRDGYSIAVARREGAAPACAAVRLNGDNAHVVFVATLPDARRQGLATECMRTVLRAAAADGCVTTTLEASAAGEPIYTAMGYASLGRYRMMQQRRTAAAS